MRGSRGTRWLWISSSRARRGSSLPFLERLPLAAPRLSLHFCSLTMRCHCFTMTVWPLQCSLFSLLQTHLPGFLERAAELKSKGIDEIACISVNDAFVMAAWGKEHGADGKVPAAFFFCKAAQCWSGKTRLLKYLQLKAETCSYVCGKCHHCWMKN